MKAKNQFKVQKKQLYISHFIIADWATILQDADEVMA